MLLKKWRSRDLEQNQEIVHPHQYLGYERCGYTAESSEIKKRKREKRVASVASWTVAGELSSDSVR